MTRPITAQYERLESSDKKYIFLFEFMHMQNSKYSKIWNTSCLPKKARTNSTDPDQTASEDL